MPQTLVLNELHTIIVGLVALSLGAILTRKLPGMKRLGLPISVVGGVLIALAVAVLRGTTGIEVEFGTEARDVLLLVFFTTVGLSAKISALKAGGKALAILCAGTVFLLVAQDLVGIGIVLLRGAHPFYGLLIGSLSFVGGPGTAIAWAMEGEAMGLPFTHEVAIGSATLATLAGALMAPLLTGLLIRRNGLSSPSGKTGVPWKANSDKVEHADGDRFRQVHIAASLLIILVAVAMGDWLNDWAASVHVVLPGFLTAMMAGVLIANLGDLFGKDLSLAPIQRGGAFSMQLFLVLSLMGLRLWVVLPIIGPLLLNVALQVAISGFLALIVLYRLLGRDYDAAVTAGGFMGFGLASMPVAFATMEEVTSRHGPSPRAYLVIALAGSFFVDLANAIITKLFLLLPMFA